MEVSRRQVIRALVAAGIAAPAGVGLYGFAMERHRIEVTRADLPCVGLPPTLAGLRIGLISDIHHGRFLPAEDVATAAALLRAERPDLVVLAGDYVTQLDRQAVGPCVGALSPLAAPLGAFAVIGNHDPEPTVTPAFRAHGIQVLRDEHVVVERRGDRIVLGGVRYWRPKAGDIARAFRRVQGFKILVAHTPLHLASAADLGIPLLLSGHTHGGQIVLPGLGALAAARYPVVAGVGRRANTTVFVSRGIGTVVVPVRLNCPPEVALLTLREGRPARVPARG